ncbi:MAG: UDP-3-O-(3-hydroxymyristoyl)glucosamine N-acyltransferase [Cardiobacteriaceae bacterium]|nr:UDP-3-O-(3-hydroxymyristoyl)glucosamine N-acyltransferase [Cardiobacteriaceae bacterium]
MTIFSITAEEIANLVQGKLVGDNCIVSSVGTLERGDGKSVGFFAGGKYREQLKDSNLALLITSEEIAPEEWKASQIIVENARVAWRILTEVFEQERNKNREQYGISDKAIISPTAKIAANAEIAAGVVIESEAEIGANTRIEPQAYVAKGVKIGENCRIGAGVRILSGTKIGNNCNILSNAVIGERGFGNSFENGRWIALPQLGGVVIGNDVEIGAGTMVDRGAVGDTIISDGVKLDNLIQVAHNVEIGEHTAIAGCTVIAGSVKIGAYCVIGGAVVINGHISICDKTVIYGHSSIAKSINKAGAYGSYFPAMPDREWKRFIVNLKNMAMKKSS